MNKKQALAIVIAASISGCAGYGGGGYAEESDAHYAARMGLIGQYMGTHMQQQPMPIMPFQLPRNAGVNVWVPAY